MQKESRVVVLGGGYGGVLAAKKLAKGIRREKLAGVDLVLIDRNPFHTMLTGLHEVAAGRVEETAVRLEFRDILAGRGIRFVQDRITEVNLRERILRGGEGREYPFDYLVIATGSRPAFYGVPGAEEYAYPLWSYGDAVELRRHLRDCFRMAGMEGKAGVRRELLTFVVAGAGFTGVEMAGELGEYLPVLCREFHVAREEAAILLVDPVGRILPGLPDKLARRVEGRLEKLGVVIRLGTGVGKVEQRRVLLTGKGEEVVPCRTVIWSAGIQGSRLAGSLELEREGRGRIRTDSQLQAVGESAEGIYVVGDNLYLVPESTGEAVPQMVENAEQSAAACARNVLAELRGRPEERKPYLPAFHGEMVSVGGRWGAAYVGTAGKKLVLPQLPAMAAKHFINLVYFLQVMGFSQAYRYLRHEFFGIRNRRSFVGGHLARGGPGFWIVPLRMFLGIMWLMEFWAKWPKFREDPSRIFLFNLPGADGVSSATVDGVATASLEAYVWGEALPVPGWIARIVDWSMGVFVAPVAAWFQGGMIFAELLLGLALLGGLCTAPAAAASALLCVMIYLSGMASQEILWYFFASVAVLGLGAQGPLSFDYYLWPWLKEKWNRLGWVRKWYLTLE